MSYRLHKEGNPYLIITIILFVMTLIFAALFTSIYTVLFFLVIAFFLILFLIFFRNPPRLNAISDANVLVAPADGKVVVIEETFEKEFLKKESIQISIFMSPLNVHSNRSPIDGEVIYQQYHSGNYLVAWHPKSSELNERNTLVIRHKEKNILIRQIAGKVARKIVSYVKIGETLTRGQEFGFIKFGSRVDVFLPLESTVLVKIGDVVQGGVTEIAKINS
jgi:phosphatidylserine decarboxylase